jgi:hypothetical protein
MATLTTVTSMVSSSAARHATLAAVQLSGGPFAPADRAEVLAAALRVLRNQD